MAGADHAQGRQASKQAAVGAASLSSGRGAMAQACQSQAKMDGRGRGWYAAALRSAAALGSDAQRGAVRGRNVHLESENKGSFGW